MPISLKHLRHDSTHQAALRNSIYLRQQKTKVTKSEASSSQVARESTCISNNGVNCFEKETKDEQQLGIHDSSVDLVAQILAKDTAYGNALRQVEFGRSQRQQRRKSEKQDMGVETLDTVTTSHEDLEFLERTFQEAHLALQDTLHQIPNYVDTELLNDFDDDDNVERSRLEEACSGREMENIYHVDNNGISMEAQHKNDKQSTACHHTKIARSSGGVQQEDVMFCIGGYDRLCSPSPDVSGDIDMLVWTDAGLDLRCSLQQAWDKWLLGLVPQGEQQSTMSSAAASTIDVKNELTSVMNTFRQWRFPSSSPAGNDDYDDESTAWRTLLHSMKGTTLYDRVLPQCHVLYRSGAGRSSSISSHLSSNNGVQVKGKRQKSMYQKQPWYDAIESEQVEGLFLTGPLVAADSRPLQIHWMRLLQSFYQNLIVSTEEMHDNSDKEKGDNMKQYDIKWYRKWMKVVAVPASQLAPAEASRLVLLGKLPQTNETIELAYLSNLYDYCSLDIRHGNSAVLQTVECSGNKNNSLTKATTLTANVHVVRGVLFRQSHALAWMLAWNRHSSSCFLPNQQGEPNNRIENNNSTGDYVWIPHSIQKHMPTHAKTIPFVRKRRVNAKGKQFVEQLSAAKPFRRREGNDSDITALKSASTLRPTKEQIHLEALSCPFFFLPFYGKPGFDKNGKSSG
ncbi:hypothetical protein ACA910_008121 [Epithemia clementina (nom. ined.)]